MLTRLTHAHDFHDLIYICAHLSWEPDNGVRRTRTCEKKRQTKKSFQICLKGNNFQSFRSVVQEPKHAVLQNVLIYERIYIILTEQIHANKQLKRIQNI